MVCFPKQYRAISVRPKSVIIAVTLTFALGIIVLLFHQKKIDGTTIAAGAAPKETSDDPQHQTKLPQSHEAARAEKRDSLIDQQPSKRLPDAIVVGAGKCGTDALITYLNTSDSFLINTIYTGDLKELNYYNNNFDKGKSWYIENMPPARSDQVVVEKCAPYLWNPVVPERVYQTKPDMKLIFVLCDPVKRLVSLYSHINSYKLSDGSDPLPPFTDIIALRDGNIHENIHPRPSQPFLESGKYFDFVTQWLKFFPRSQLAFISGEDLIADPLSQVTGVIEFLGKPGSVTEHNVYYDTERGYYCFRSHDGSSWCMDKSSKGRKHPQLEPEVLSALQNHFKSYNEKLEALVGVRFGWPRYFGKRSK